MRKIGTFGRGQFMGLLALCILFGGSGVYGQRISSSTATAAPCSVRYLRLRIATGGDDLRGGNDNLNVTIRFGEKGFQGAANVNRGETWGNNSVHMVEIKLTHPVPLNEIKNITLDHLAKGGLTISPETVLSPVGVIAGLKTADNWDMQSLAVTAVGDNASATILRHGPKRFTADDPILNTRVDIPANSCVSMSAGNPGNTSSGTGLLGSKPGATGSGAGSSSKKLTPQQLTALLTKVHSTTGKTSPVVTNPAAGQKNMAMMTALQRQRQTALTERNQSPASGGGSTPTPAPTPTRTAMIARAPAIRGPITTTAAPPPSSTPNRGAIMTSPNLNVACGTFHTAMVTAVSGQEGNSAIFTQDPQGNPFTIHGCNFGSGKGQAQLNYSDGRKLTDLTVDTWTDSLITVELPSSLIGVVDQPNVTLVLFPTNGPQAQRSGFQFYAQRAELHLTSIPASEVTLAPIRDDSGGTVAAKFSSPYVNRIGTTGPPTGTVAGGVDRVNIVRFPGGTDTFDFSRLKPGFTVEKFQVTELSFGVPDGCGFDLGVGDDTDYTDGTWDWHQIGNTIRVTWQESHVHSSNCSDDGSNASYGLDVWLIGPVFRPTDNPWQDGVK